MVQILLYFLSCCPFLKEKHGKYINLNKLNILHSLSSVNQSGELSIMDSPAKYLEQHEIRRTFKDKH